MPLDHRGARVASQQSPTLHDGTVKVTLGLSRRSVEFFKRQAKKHETQYQKMIRRLLDLYVDRQGA